MPRIQDIGAFNAVREAGLSKLVPQVPRIAVGMGTCGRGNGAEGVYHAFAEAIDRTGADIVLANVGCFGPCFQETIVNVRLPGSPLLVMRKVQANDAPKILHDIQTGNVTPDHVYCKVEEWDHITANVKYGHGYPEVPSWTEVPFFKGQKKIVLRNCGLINPDDIEEYVAIGG
jgi:NADH-quinone oxidoreductase subunit F